MATACCSWTRPVISEKVASALALKLTGEEHSRMTKHYTENAEAYQLYVNGRFYWERRTSEGLKRAIEYFGEAQRCPALSS